MKAPLRTALRTAAALLLASLVLVPAASAQEAAAADLASLIAMNLDAKGGEEALRGVESARITGTMSMGGGQMTAPFVWEWKAPDKLRVEFTIQGMTGIQAYDGETAWMIMPFMGKTDPEKMPEEQTVQFAEQADFHGPFLDTEAKGYTLEYAGEEEVEGTPAHKVKSTNEHGDVTWLYLDKEYGLEIQSVSEREIQGQQVEATTAIGDYKEVGGLMLAHSFDVALKGAPMGGQTLSFESVELNPELADDRFAMPAAPAPAAEAPAPAAEEKEPADDGGDGQGTEGR
jgi:outer membrane lipoprotein-sorting protein